MQAEPLLNLIPCRALLPRFFACSIRFVPLADPSSTLVGQDPIEQGPAGIVASIFSSSTLTP